MEDVSLIEVVIYIANIHLGSLLMTIVGVPSRSLMGMELKRERKVDVVDTEDMWTRSAGVSRWRWRWVN